MGEGNICIFYSLMCYIWQEDNWQIMGSQKIFVEGLLVVKWLRLHAPNAWGLGSIPGQGYQAMKTTWRCLKHRFLSGRSQSEGAAYRMIPTTRHFWKRNYGDS